MDHGVPGERMVNSGSIVGLKAGEPPNLLEYSNEPKYDLAHIVGSLNVRPMILWGWEQQLGIPAPTQVNDDLGGPVRRYSERDLVASIWLRDQILKGVSPSDAVARLQAAQRPVVRDSDSWEGGEVAATFEEPQPIRGRVMTGPLPDSTLSPRQQRSYPAQPDASNPSVSGSFPQPAYSSGLGRAQTSSPPRRVSYGPALGSAPQTARPTGNLYGGQAASTWVSPVSGPLRPTSGPLFSTSGPLGAGASVGYGGTSPLRQESSPVDMSSVGVPWVGPAATSTRGRELRTLVPQLVRAFTTFDTLNANHIVSEALSSRSVENVCMHLFQPVLARLGELCLHRNISGPEERFAVNYVRGVLFGIFHRTPERFDGPMIIIGCGQRELQDTSALMLAVFGRRIGLRVIYLGQDVESDGLLDEIRKRRPALVALDISSTHRIRTLARLAKDVSQLDAPRPVFGFTGDIFVQNPDLKRKVKHDAEYLGDDTFNATLRMAGLLGL